MCSIVLENGVTGVVVRVTSKPDYLTIIELADVPLRHYYSEIDIYDGVSEIPEQAFLYEGLMTTGFGDGRRCIRL